MRYYPPKAYIKIQDFKGGLAYLNWFIKNFPDDSGFPDFLFQWALILFKAGKIVDAEKKTFETYCSNTYLFDKYFGRPIIPINKYEYSNIDCPSYADSFEYSNKQIELSDFSEWLKLYLETEKFKSLSSKFIEISKRLKSETDNETRIYLIKQLRQLETEG